MISAIVQAAYPNTYAALEEAMERAAETRNETWVPPASKLKEAIARDLVSHQHAILGRGVSFDESGGVIATETLYFLRRSKSRYEPIEAAHLREFTLGRRKLKPESDGFVRVALAKVALNIEDSDEIEFEAVGYKFRTKPDGTIIDVHRADAFPEDQAQGEAALFEARRNQAVSWELTDEDVNALERAVERHRGRFQRPIHDRDRD
jgi:hypothetical protein